nr:prepilin-type N-terminal cleavage/methylation domain-containing protein [Neobacillus sp. Marseille-Q6967]
MKRGEDGLTLVEVLATLVILSIISISVWSIFFQGFNFSQKAISKNSMIQEANLIITNLKSIHQTSDGYDIENSSSKCEILVYLPAKNDPNAKKYVYSNANMCINFKIKNGISSSINPHQDDALLELSVSDKNDSDNKIALDTLLYRVKGVDYQ